jgi:hypothetical protein
MMSLAAIIEKIKYLPPLDQKDAITYIEELIKKNQIKKGSSPDLGSP